MPAQVPFPTGMDGMNRMASKLLRLRSIPVALGMAMMGAVVGLGQCSLDLLGRVEDFPAVDQKAELAELLVQGGGPVATALVTLARLGGDPLLSGGSATTTTAAHPRRAGSGGGRLRRAADRPGPASQFAFIAVDAAARRTIFWHRGSARPLAAAELPPALLAGRPGAAPRRPAGRSGAGRRPPRPRGAR